MLEFYDRFMYLCARHQMSPSAAANAIGLSNAAATGWKKGKVPSDITIAKLAQLFDVPVSYLTGKEEKETPTAQMDSEVSDAAMELWSVIKDAKEDELRLLMKMYQAIRSERDNG